MSEKILLIEEEKYNILYNQYIRSQYSYVMTLHKAVHMGNSLAGWNLRKFHRERNRTKKLVLDSIVPEYVQNFSEILLNEEKKSFLTYPDLEQYNNLAPDCYESDGCECCNVM